MRKFISMRTIRGLVCAGVAVAALQSCATGPSSRALTAADLLTASYTLPGGQAFDADALFAAFPAWLSVAHDGASFDAARGAMVVDNPFFSIAGGSDAGIRADRAVIWGGDAGAMQAVVSGAADQRAMTALFDRISLEGVRSEGMQWEAGTESASLSIDRVVIDGLAARSFALDPKAGAGEGAAVLRKLGAIMGSFSYDGAAYSNFAFGLTNSKGDKVEMRVAEAFSRDYSAGATSYESVRGLSAIIEGMGGAPLVEVSARQNADEESGDNAYAKIMNKPAAETVNEFFRHPAAFLAAAAGGIAVEYQIDSIESRNSNLSNALTWLARWELPPITETELIDLGTQTVLGYRQIMNGVPAYTVERMEVTAADFYWLVPSHYDIAYTGVTYDMSVMMDEVQRRMGPGHATEAAAQFDEMMETMTALGLDRIAGDMGMSWRWNGENGDMALTTSSDIIDSFAGVAGLRLGGPSLATWDQMARTLTPAAAAAEQITVQGFNLSFTDNGFVDRVFDYAAAENGAGTGPELRQTVAAMARLSGAQAAQMNSRIPAYAEAFAAFLEQGGTISALASPPSPVGAMALQAAAQAAPQTLPDVLNLTITHGPQ